MGFIPGRVSARSPYMWAAMALACIVGNAAGMGAQTAQNDVATRGSISGAVVDAATMAPLPASTVVLSVIGAIVSSQNGHSPFLSTGSVAVTDSLGRYRFIDMAPGEYSLRVQRMGYRPAVIMVQLRGAGDSRVSIGITIAPITLAAVQVRADAAQSYGRMSKRDDFSTSTRVAAVRQRQRTFLASDVREITHNDVSESVTLGETDLFRALQRLPGVKGRDEYSAELWTRGGRWDETRIYFDGLPLFNPLHAFGAFSGVGSDAIGAAFLHPGVRPASIAEGGSGVLDLESRSGGGDGHVRGVGELSVISGRLALDRRSPHGSSAWMISARRSYLDVATRAIQHFVGGNDIYIPYHFSDVSARFDHQIDANRAIETSVLWERDRVTGDVADVVHGNTAGWGNGIARVTFIAPMHGLHTRHTIGISRYAASVDERQPDSAIASRYSASTAPPIHSTVSYATVEGRIEPEAVSGAKPIWSAGYQLTRQAVSNGGAGVRPYASLYDSRIAQPPTRSNAIGVLALWAERQWHPLTHFTAETGLRLEAGTSVLNGGVLRPAPRLLSRYEVNTGTFISAGIGRSFQYTQAMPRDGTSVNQVLYPVQAWLLANGDIPVLRTDITTLGAERWFSSGILASANVYERRASGAVVRDPTPGDISSRALFANADERARGVELSLRRIAGRTTWSAGYSYGTVTTEALGFRYPSTEDRRHGADATVMTALTKSFRVGAAYTATTGSPYTRIRSSEVRVSRDGGQVVIPPIAELPNAMRGPMYTSLDLLLDWTHDFRSWQLGAYLQLYNALDHPNPAVYTAGDHFESGLPRFPLAGLRIAF